jgi:hippurate hydrolase
LISGRGSHGAQPHQSVDPTMVAVALAQALQTIVSRNVDPLRAAVLSVTQIEAGTAYNIVPETARLAGTIRTFDDDVRKLIARRMLELTEGIAAGFGAIATVSVSDCFRVLVNSPLHAEAAIDIARGVAREVSFREDPMTGSEDFADMLAIIPGAYLFLGQGDGPMLHNPAYDFNDGILPVGVSLLVRLAEGRARVLSEN